MSASIEDLLTDIAGETAEQTVEFATELPPITKRKLTIVLGRNEVRYQLRATLPAHDPRAAAVLRGDGSAAAFIRSVHGTILFDGTSYSSVQVTPLTINARNNSVEILQERSGLPISVFEDGKLGISRSWENSTPVARDEIEIRAEFPKLTGYFPAPTRARDNIIVWRAVDEALPRDLTVFVDATRSQPDLWAVGPRNVVPRYLVGFVQDGLAIIPLLWFLAIIRHRFANRPAAHRTALRRITLLLGAFVVFGTMANMPFDLSRELSQLASAMLGEAVFDFPVRLRELSLTLTYIILFLLFGIWWFFTGMRGIVAEAATDIRAILLKATVWGLLYNILWVVAGNRYDLTGVVEAGLVYGPWIAAFLVCALIGYFLIDRLWSTARLVSGLQPRIGPGLVLLTVIVLLILGRPGTFLYDPTFDSVNSPFYDAVFTVLRFVNQLGSLAPILAAFLICATLLNKSYYDGRKTRFALAMLLFAGTLAGMGQVWIVVPVSFLLALLIFPQFVLIRKERILLLKRYGNEIISKRDDYLTIEFDHAKQFVPSASWFGLGLFGLNAEDKQKKREYVPLKATIDGGAKVPLAELAFAFGQSDKPFENAVAALRVGAWGALFFVLIYAVPSFSATDHGDHFPYLSALSRVVSVGGYWMIAAFFFGYFYDLIRGAAGWKKGMVLALGITLAREPLAILAAQSAADYAAIGISVIQRFAFFLFIGLLAFDIRTFRAAAGKNIDWRLFPLVAGLSVVEAVVSVAIAGAGVAATTTFTGQLTTVLGQVATELIPTTDQGTTPPRDLR
ncbi:hypothetical protein [Hoeflea poritis]|uniref:Beta-carotene 15,15'-monooxygenase n=1 Tax=Hoeflea poritis TaxID=2993659 RepID=A0ABT4VVV1_9HYPH|nr:hypothetical protein [Hoeflea poritis]MDA4848754.1 hypothetical protein [Hoeflea poritis]